MALQPSSLRKFYEREGIDPSRGLRSRFFSDQFSGGLRALMFPENHVDILHDYPLPSRATVATLLSRLIVTNIVVDNPDLPGNQLANSVNSARQTLLRFLQQPAIDESNPNYLPKKLKQESDPKGA